MFQCPVCGKESIRIDRHVKKEHGLGFEDFLITYKHGGVRPTCGCGCGGRVTYAQGKFTRYVQGHWRPSAEERKKMSVARQAYFAADPERRRSVGETMKRYRAENPGIQSEMSRKAWRDHPERFKRSTETIKRIAETNSKNWTDARRAEASELRRKFWADNPDKLRESIAKTAAKNVVNQEWRDRISLGVSLALTTKSFAWEMGQHVSTKTGRCCRYRSSWELARMCELDSDPDVLDWESEPFQVSYQLDGRWHRYTPDLVIFRRSGVTVEEVGVPCVKGSARNAAKRESLERICADNGWSLSWAWSPKDHPRVPVDGCSI